MAGRCRYGSASRRQPTPSCAASEERVGSRSPLPAIRPVHHAALFVLTAALIAQGPAKKPDPAVDPAREFFASNAVIHLAIELPAAERAKLRAEPRKYVTCTMRLDGKTTWTEVGIKLKGSAGSFRSVDDRPGMTIKLDKFSGAGATAASPQQLHGLTRFHLNNCVQDDTYLHEWLGCELFTAAGLPAPRVSHARVTLDGQDLGLYVLREAFDKKFLHRAFGATTGNLYDGGFCQDIDTDLHRESGDGNDDHADLHRLVELCRGNSDPQRVAALQVAVDVPQFVDFVALEAMLNHWDGYSQNRNNYRLWFEPKTGRAHFLPHGMDQLFGDAGASVLNHPPALVASAVLENPEWRKRYRQRLRELLPLFAPDRLLPRIEAVTPRLQAALREFEAGAATAHADAIRGLKERVTARYRNLVQQSTAPEPKPLPFPGNRAVTLRDWRPAPEGDRIALTKKDFNGVGTLRVFCGTSDGKEVQAGSWRTSVLLAKGHYRLQATARSEGVTAPAVVEGQGDAAGGVAVLVDGNASERLTGDRQWKALSCDFEVGEFQRTVELVLELRGVGGKVWFRADSLQLSKLKD